MSCKHGHMDGHFYEDISEQEQRPWCPGDTREEDERPDEIQKELAWRPISPHWLWVVLLFIVVSGALK